MNRKATQEEADRIIAELTSWVDRLAEETQRAQQLLEELRPPEKGLHP